MTAVGFVYLAVILIAYMIAIRLDKTKTRDSLDIARKSFIKVLPLLFAVFLLVGLFQVFLPAELIERWLGEASGPASLLIATVAGAVAIGPPLTAFPLAGSLLQGGAWPPAIAAFIVSWISVGLITLPFEASVFGPRFAVTRNILVFLSAMLIGLLAGGML
ncbi:MAG: permease [Thermodesulfobacteriota bacterium]|jgi:uncharacterized membrane protein YraQ (UPF0718 family)|nr:permease [Thermodesulfobacteriota bacterium]